MLRTVGLIAVLLLFATLAPARALHREDIPVLKQLAHEMERLAAHVHRAGEAQAHHFTRREVRLLGSLHHFHGQAAEFHRTVDSYFTSPAPVLAALEHLNADADRVERHIYRAHAMSHVVNDWNRAALLLRQINGYFATGGEVGLDDHHHD